MSKEHIIWTSDTGTLDMWTDAIEEDLMEKDDDYILSKGIEANNAWAEKVSADPDKYDEMKVKDYREMMLAFIEKYKADNPANVDEYIQLNREKCNDYVYKLNNGYLGDEMMNLKDIKTGRIIYFGTPFFVSAPNELVSVSACLDEKYLRSDAFGKEYYVQDGDFKCTETDHDGKWYSTYRAFPVGTSDEFIDEIIDKVEKTKDFSVIYDATESLAPEICKVYGWEYEPNEYDLVLPGQDNGRK